MPDTITVFDLRERLARPEPWQLVDVRSGSEYGTDHIPAAINIPLEQIERRTADLGNHPIVLICKSGQRAHMAAALLKPCGKRVMVLEGGTDAWKHAGLPLVANVTSRWSLERQVRLLAGLLVTVGVVLAIVVSSWWISLAGFVGVGLVFAGLTDFCPMARVLARLPWNVKSRCPAEAAQSHGCCSQITDTGEM